MMIEDATPTLVSLLASASGAHHGGAPVRPFRISFNVQVTRESEILSSKNDENDDIVRTTLTTRLGDQRYVGTIEVDELDPNPQCPRLACINR